MSKPVLPFMSAQRQPNKRAGAKGGRGKAPPFLTTAFIVSGLSWILFLVLSVLAAWRPGETLAGEGAFAGSMLVASVGLTAIVVHKVERSWTGVWIGFGFAVGLTVILISAWIYWPCAPGWRKVFALPGWILRVFFGDYETDGTGKVCGIRLTPGLDTARTLGLILTVAGALSIVLLLAGRQVDRLAVRFHPDVDAVVGLGPDSMPLISALVEQNARRQRREEWIRKKPRWLGGTGTKQKPRPGYARWWLTGLRPGDWQRIAHRRTRTVVIEPDENNPHIAKARQLGAVVIIGDAKEERILSMVATRWSPTGRRITLRRLFIVTSDETYNFQVWKALDAGISVPGLRDHVDDVIPRAYVRMDDARDAQVWRASHYQRVGRRPTSPDGRGGNQGRLPPLVSDALTMDAIAAEIVCGVILPRTEWLHSQQHATHLVLIGEGSLPLAILDELAWQQWCRFEVGQRRWKKYLEKLQKGEAVNQHFAYESSCDARPRLRDVTLVGPTANARRNEWERLRPPLALPAEGEYEMLPFLTRAVDEDPETYAEDVLSNHPYAVVVFTEHDPATAAAAARLARRFATGGGFTRVIVRGDSQSEQIDEAIPGGLVKFVPTLARERPIGRGASNDSVSAHASWRGAEPPVDSVSRLARQQHQAMFRAEAGWPGASESPGMNEVVPTNQEKGGERVTRRDWEELPAFFQEDNVRQLWQVITWFVEKGYTWTPVGGSGAVRPCRGEDFAETLGEAEHKRWKELRERRGWWKGDRNDGARTHLGVMSWADLEAKDKDSTRQQVTSIVDRLWALGLTPRPTPTGNSETAVTGEDGN